MPLRKPQIRIKSTTGRWVNIMYISSSAKSRIPLQQLKSQIKQDLIDVVNPELLDD